MSRKYHNYKTNHTYDTKMKDKRKKKKKQQNVPECHNEWYKEG